MINKSAGYNQDPGWTKYTCRLIIYVIKVVPLQCSELLVRLKVVGDEINAPSDGTLVGKNFLQHAIIFRN